ncbi:MAG: mechanosensitive ion channel domain-containing protein, partial [Rhizobiaceae bacterium]
QGLQDRVNQLQQQLTELGKPPADGDPPEAPETQLRRETLNKNFAEADGLLKNARLSEIRARQLQKEIGDLLHSRFIQSISIRTPGLTTTTFWRELIAGFGGFYKSLNLLLRDSFSVFVKQLGTETRRMVLLPFFLLLLSLAVLRIRSFLVHLIKGEEATFGAESVGNAVSGFVYYLKNGIVPGLIPFLVHRILSGLDLLTTRLDQLLNDVVIGIGVMIAVIALLHVFLAPKRPDKRVTHISDASARKIFSVLSTTVILAIAVFILHRTAVVLVSPLEVSVGLSLIFALLIGGSSLWANYEIRKDRRARIRSHDVTDVISGFWYYVLSAMWLTAVIILVTAIFGYIAFADFLSQQLLFGFVVVLSAWLLLRFVDYVSSHYAVDNNPATQDAIGEASTSRQTLILGVGAIKLAIYCLAGAFLLLPWGYRTADFYEVFRELFFGFEIGGLSISLSTVLLAFLLFFVGYTVTVALRNWLNNKYLPTTKLDIGISNSISTVFGYAGFVLAAVLAISAAGFDLSNLAIVAGALSVGVGFGLQSIVNNFVSGLILLAERPIKAGDWVSTSGGEGYVRKISVRSTEIETFDRATVVVPNSTLITEDVTNYTHSGKSGRIIIAVGVGYGSDPEEVRSILLACADQHKMVLGRPAPVVYFMDFGASSLDFQLRCFLSDVNYSVSVQSDLRFEILNALRKANIEIPFPQQDVHIKSGPPDAKKEEIKPKTRTRKPVSKTPGPRQKDSE